MARAKRTDRSEARRRHRAQLAEAYQDVDPDALEETDEEAPATPAARIAPATRQRATAGPDRPAPAGGIGSAFRQAFRPLTLREDIALLPKLLRHRAFWLPCLISVAVGAAFIAFRGQELITGFAFTYFVAPPPVGAIFLAGFLAPRASYLIGALVGVVSSFVLAAVVGAVPEQYNNASPVQGLIAGLFSSPLSGVFFGSAAAWYRRFLYLASPARQAAAARRNPPPRSKPARTR